MQLLIANDIFALHEEVINPQELQGIGVGKSIDSIILRIQSRLDYDLVQDEFDLSAMYAVFIARGHIFNDANKRTAFIAMDTALRVNGIVIKFNQKEIGDIIIQVAQGIIDEVKLAQYLRTSYQEQTYKPL